MTQITELTEITTLADDDLLVTRDLDAAIDKKITWSSIKAELKLNGTHSDTQILFNNSGAISGHSGLTYDGNGILTVNNIIKTNIIRPIVDSTTAFRVQNAAGDTAVFTIDTANNFLKTDGSMRIGTGTFDSGSAFRIDKFVASSGTYTGIAGEIENSAAFVTQALAFGASANHTSGTMPALNGVVITLINKNTNSVSNARGLRINSIVRSGSGSISNNYAIVVEDQIAATNNYAIYTNAGLVRFGDRTILSASTTSRASMTVTPGTTPTSPNDGDVWNNGTNIQVRLGGVTYNLDMTPV